MKWWWEISILPDLEGRVLLVWRCGRVKLTSIQSRASFQTSEQFNFKPILVVWVNAYLHHNRYWYLLLLQTIVKIVDNFHCVNLHRQIYVKNMFCLKFSVSCYFLGIIKKKVTKVQKAEIKWKTLCLFMKKFRYLHLPENTGENFLPGNFSW